MPIDYHQNNGSVSSPNDFIISQSAFNQLDPLLGGHPTKFLRYFTDERKKTPSMETGDLFHQWQEHPNEFVVAELDAPAEQMKNFSETFHELYFKEGYKKDHVFVEYCKKSFIVDMDDHFKIHELYTIFHGTKADEQQFLLLANCIFYARKEAQVDKRLVNKTILGKFQTECLNYIKFLKDAGGRIIMSKQNKETLSTCQESYNNHPTVKKLLDLGGSKEEEFFWEETVDGIVIKRKAKLDWYHVDHNKREITITDTKTTSKPVSNFNHSDGAFFKYNLGRQLRSYVDPIVDKLGLGNEFIGYTLNLFNIVLQTTEDNACAVFKMTWPNIDLATKSLDSIKKRTAFHIKSGNWNLTMEEQQNGFIEI